MDPKAYWIAFSHVSGVGAVRLRSLLAHFGDLEHAWTAPYYELARAGLSRQLVERILEARARLSVEALWQNVEKKGVTVLTWQDALYPHLLSEIEQPPPVLYLRGEINPVDEMAIAVVGTRNPSAYGRAVAEQLGGFFALQGITLVSGLARGIDQVAHQAVLKGGGRTLAVLGSGVDQIYPPEHEGLAAHIAKQGAIVSDYALGTPPDSRNFPPRNRIISGLSKAVIVVEAPEKSGALITATFAGQQGRDVFAVPGTIHSVQSRGTNRLILNGALPYLNFEQILEALHVNQAKQQFQARSILPEDAVEAQLSKFLSPEGTHIDEISKKSGLPIDQVLATLSIMELKGMARDTGGMTYVSIREEPADYRIRP